MSEVPAQGTHEQEADPLAFLSAEDMQVLEDLVSDPDQGDYDEWSQLVNDFLTTLSDEDRKLAVIYLEELSALRARAAASA